MVVKRAIKPTRKKPTPKIAPGKSFSEELLALARTVPDAEWEKLPRDGASNLDHYIYGTPKDE